MLLQMVTRRCVYNENKSVPIVRLIPKLSGDCRGKSRHRDKSESNLHDEFVWPRECFYFILVYFFFGDQGALFTFSIKYVALKTPKRESVFWWVEFSGGRISQTVQQRKEHHQCPISVCEERNEDH